MVEFVAQNCYWAFLILALASLFVPIFLMWRLAALSALAFATGALIEGPVHWSDQNFAWALGILILLLFSGIVTLLIALRLIYSALRKTLSVEKLRGPQTWLVRSCDYAAYAAVGCSAGLMLTERLAYAFSGVSLINGFDLFIALCASVLAVLVVGYSRKMLPVLVSTACATLAVAAFLGSRQTNQILETAEALADGRAWCLTTSYRSAPVSEVGQLGFFALQKENSYPHLGLLMRDGGKMQFAAHWSIRRQKFEESIWGRSAEVPSCHPIENFVEALENGTVQNGVFGVGSDIYKIEPELHPRAFINRISIRSDDLVGPQSVYPEVSEVMSLVYDPRRPNVPDGAVPLAMMPDPKEVPVSVASGRERLVVAGFDEQTEQYLFLECVNGAYADRLCRARIFESTVSYDFYIPLNQIDQWRDATQHVKTLFQSLRVVP